MELQRVKIGDSNASQVSHFGGRSRLQSMFVWIATQIAVDGKLRGGNRAVHGSRNKRAAFAHGGAAETNKEGATEMIKSKT